MRQKGITIIEIILYVSLLSIFLLVLLDIFVGGLNLQMDSRSFSAVQADGRFILSRLAYDLKNADSVTAPSLGETSQTLVVISSGIARVFSLNQGVLSISENGTIQALNSLETEVTSITFKGLGNVDGKKTVQINFTIRSRNIKQGSQIETRSYQFTGGLR